MELSLPENPSAAAPALARCIDLPRALAGADADAVERAAESLAGQLKQLGWQTVSDTPGLRMYSNNGRMLAVDQLIGMLASGHVSASHWQTTCATDGISELMVPVPSAQAPNAELIDPFSLPVALHADPVMNPPSSRRLAVQIFLIVLLVAAGVWVRVIHPWQQQSHLAGHGQPKSEKEVKADGTLSVNEGAATVNYVKQSREFESTSTRTSDFYFPDMTYRADSTLSEWNDFGRHLTKIVYSRTSFDLTTERGLELYLNNRNVSESQDARKILTPKKVKIAGRTGYEWEYVTPKNWWIYSVRVPQGRDAAYHFSCRVMPVEDAAARQARCRNVAKTLTFRGAGK